MVFPGSLGLKVSLAEGELRGKEEAPAHCPPPWMWFWRLGWLFNDSSVTITQMMLLIQSYLSSQDSENQSHPKWDKFCPTFKYVIQLQLWAGFCVQWKSPASKCLDHRLVGGAKCSTRLWSDNKSFGPTAGVWNLTHGHLEILAHWAFISPDPPVGLAAAAHTRAMVCAFVYFCPSLASLHVPWAKACGLPVYALEQLEFLLSVVTLKILFNVLY